MFKYYILLSFCIINLTKSLALYVCQSIYLAQQELCLSIYLSIYLIYLRPPSLALPSMGCLTRICTGPLSVCLRVYLSMYLPFNLSYLRPPSLALPSMGCLTRICTGPLAREWILSSTICFNLKQGQSCIHK